MTKFLIVIPTVGRPAALLDCVKSIQEETEENYHMIVVGDAAFKSTEDITVLPAPGEIGFSKAVNLGAEAIKSEYVVWLNDDCLVDSNWLTKMGEFMGGHQHVGIGAFFFHDTRWPNDGYNVFYYQNLVYPNFGCARRFVWEELRGFDLAFYGYGGETDLASRCRQKGWEVAPAAGARIRHLRLVDEPRKKLVSKMGDSYKQLRIMRDGDELNTNLHCMNDSGRKQTHDEYQKGIL